MNKKYLNVFMISAVFLMLFTPLVSNQVVNAAIVQSISLTKSGLIVSDPLNNETKTQQQLQSNPRYWTYGGDAIALKAPYAFFKDTRGLHIGVQSPGNSTYAGFYAVTPSTNALLYHVILTTPVRTIPSQGIITSDTFQNGLYVQTTQAPVNYVTCFSITNNQKTVWSILHTYGTPFGSVVFDTLWTDPSQNQPLTRECTIITNGQNYLKVYLDGVMVYSNKLLALGMPAPFNAFLEPQNSYRGQLINATFTDFYMTANETIQIIKNPSNAKTVTVTSSSGAILASAPVSNGNATVDVGKYHFPLAANIHVYDSSNTLIASTSSFVNIFGGNVYSVNPLDLSENYVNQH
ncbi:MAG TPA: hypothetical protein VGR54_04705 [Nitrosopumilaceae archaeon]|nr:hypothetical protein [Nitrosopumilaceae archaeon]